MPLIFKVKFFFATARMRHDNRKGDFCGNKRSARSLSLHYFMSKGRRKRLSRVGEIRDLPMRFY